jgi:2-amino-4-hydroxy-6-hydroxymethyldihydropteridine diphosphokinase
MILIALGSNMPGPWGTSEETVKRALTAFDTDGMKLVASSRLMITKPYGKLNQPTFVNAVARIETHAPPFALLKKLHAIERAAGRRRKQRWGPRTLDLDIVDHHGLILNTGALILPHPGIAQRIFVLRPIVEIAPNWRHPIHHRTAALLLRRLSQQDAGSEV